MRTGTLQRMRRVGLLVTAAVAAGVWTSTQVPPVERPFEVVAGIGAAAPRQAASRLMRARLDRLETAARRRTQVLVPLPGGEELAIATATFQPQPGGFFAAGPVVGTTRAGVRVDGEAAFTVVGDRVIGRVVSEGRLFRIARLQGSAFHRIEEIPRTDILPDGDPVPVPDGEGPALTSPTLAALDGADAITLLLVYTPAARDALGGTAAIEAEAIAAVNHANLALQNSGVTHRYAIAHVALVDYIESGRSEVDLGRLQTIGDGYLDGVHALRDEHHADVVTLLTQSTDACGVGYIMGPGSVSTSFHRWAFNVTVARVCAAANLSLAHEVGHNLGLQHDRPNVATPPAFDFAYGYNVPGLARTVMAYACASGGACPRLAIFSTPRAAFPNSATTAGTATEDNARVLNLTAATAANFRDSTCTYTLSATAVTAPLTGGSGTIAVTTGSGCGWSAVSSDPAVAAISGAASGLGSGTVGYLVSAAAAPRSTTLVIAGRAVTVSQGACQPEMFVTAGTPAPFPRAGGSGSVTITTPSGCGETSWSLGASESFVSWSGATTGAGSAVVPFVVSENTLAVDRGAEVTLTTPGFAAVTRQILQVGPRLSVAVPSLTLRAAKGAPAAPLQAWTAQQRVTVTIDAASPRPWTAVSDQPWLQVVRGAGAGSGTFDVRIVNPGNVLGGSSMVTANVTVTADGFEPQVFPFVLTLSTLQDSGLPFGFLDTPIAGTTVSGAIPVTGWALAGTAVTRIELWRDGIDGIDAPAGVQPNGWVYLGEASRVTGARPDVAAAFAGYPERHQAGWGHLLLTNMLPHRSLGTPTGGQGEFTIHVTATQQGSVMAQIGQVTVTVDNDAATRPFGALDTPSQGGAASGVFPVFGWALARGAAMIPTNGSTMAVFVDGVSVGRPTYNQCRGSNLAGGGSPVLSDGGTCTDDIAALFAPRGHLNVAPGTGRGAIGSFDLDTRTLANGLHSIAWSVTDSLGRTEGIGSRNFIVSNAGADDDPYDRMAPLAVAALVDGRRVEPRVVQARRGFDLTAPFEPIAPDGAQRRYLRVRELDRVEIDFGGRVLAGYLRLGADLVALPIGSSLDAPRGRFSWAPAAGFLGPFELVFLTPQGRVPVSIELVARELGPAHDGMRMHLDRAVCLSSRPGAGTCHMQVDGWALDASAWHGTGVGAVHVWANARAGCAVRSAGLARRLARRSHGEGGSLGEGGCEAIFLGVATLGVARPDVAQAFGPQFSHAGFSLSSGVVLPAGQYEVTAYVWSTRTGRFEDARSAGSTRSTGSTGGGS